MQTKQIQSLINKAIKATTGYREAIQAALGATIRHCWEHGDTSLLNRLIAELPKGAQLEKIKQYVQETAPVRPNKSADIESKGYYKYKACNAEVQVISLSLLTDINWWDYQPIKQQADKVIDTAKVFKAALTSLLQKLQEQTDLTPLEQEALIAMERAVNSRIPEDK